MSATTIFDAPMLPRQSSNRHTQSGPGMDKEVPKAGLVRHRFGGRYLRERRERRVRSTVTCSTRGVKYSAEVGILRHSARCRAPVNFDAFGI